MAALKTIKEKGGLVSFVNSSGNGNIFSVTYNANGRGYQVESQGEEAKKMGLTIIGGSGKGNIVR